MRNKLLIAFALTITGPAVAGAYTIRAPIVARLTGANGSSWFTETRVWNLGKATASVSVTDIIGWGDVQPLSFTIPPNGIEDLPSYFFNSDLTSPTDFMATVEFTSDQPIVVDTSVNTYMVTRQQCPSGAGFENPIAFFAYWAGCVPIAGPLVHGFETYLQAGTRNGLSWLVADWESFRTNLYLVNPSATPVTVTAIYSGVQSDVTVTYRVAPHSLLVLPEIFGSPPLTSLGAGTKYFRSFRVAEAAATAAFSADGPFYVFAAVASNDTHLHPSVVNRFAIVQPIPLP